MTISLELKRNQSLLVCYKLLAHRSSLINLSFELGCDDPHLSIPHTTRLNDLFPQRSQRRALTATSLCPLSLSLRTELPSTTTS